jgi:hypothetical protein
MRKLTIAQMQEAVTQLVIRMNKRVIFKGRFGIGKSAGINLAAAALNSPEALKALLGDDCPYVGCQVIDIRLGQYDSVDLRGFPHPDKASGTAIWYPPATFPFIGNDNFRSDILYLVFLDEFTSASTAVFAVCYQLILDNCIGEHVVMDNVRICMAGNLDDDKGVVNKIPMPLYNRMVQFEVVNPKDDFCFHAQAVGIPPMFIALWNFKENLINTYDPKSTATVVATQRSWFEAVSIFQDVKLTYDLKEAAMVGCIGEGPTTETMAFNEIWKTLIPIKEIIKDPESVALPTEPSLKFAMAMHISGNMTPKNIGQLYKYLVRMPPEFVVMSWQLATERDKNLFNVPAFIDYMKRYRDVYTN